jgi:hypothetical protein
LRELENSISDYLYNRNDGFIYICKVRSYGRRWKLDLTNEVAVNDLCREYDGEDGIVDVYTTNPDAKIQNYGQVFYIKSEEDYDKWRKSNELMDFIKTGEDYIKEQKSPHYYTEENILGCRNELELLEWTYEEPVLLNKDEDYE